MLYVGQASKIRSRWMSHHKLTKMLKHPNARIYWLVCEPAQLMELELLWWQDLKPSMNKRRPSPTPSTDTFVYESDLKDQPQYRTAFNLEVEHEWGKRAARDHRDAMREWDALTAKRQTTPR